MAWVDHPIEEPILFCYEACELCPRRCKVDRVSGEIGVCGEEAQLRIAAIEAHTGEEPPISSLNGSGTVFFSGCSLRCLFCQNHQISREGFGRTWNVGDVVDRLAALHWGKGIHNVNFVTPDHFFPHTVAIVRRLRERGIRIPVVYNLSGYQRVETLRQIEPVADIYLPDFKYGDEVLAKTLSGCPDYAMVALEAVYEMIRQKGFLDTFAVHGDDEIVQGDLGTLSRPARKGVLVRHLVLPGHVENSLKVLSMLCVEFGRDLPISLMSQYVPVHRFPSGSPLNRWVNRVEFTRVLQHAQDLGFYRLFVQYPEEEMEGPEPFLPDFRLANPFRGNTRNRT